MNPFIRTSSCLFSCCVMISIGLLSGCGGGESTTPAPPPIGDLNTNETVPSGPPYFKELSPSETGVNFTYRNGEDKGHLAILESLGGGVGLIDFDNDGLLDLFCPAGGDYEKSEKEMLKAKDKSIKILGHPCKLFKNKGNFQFEDVSDQVLKLNSEWMYSHGCAVGDYDCDGWADLLVTGYHKLILFHNEQAKDGKGRVLVEVTQKAGLTNKEWSSSAAWGDLNGDGYPELYVCNYANWSWQNHPRNCTYVAKVRDVCAPKSFQGTTDVLYLNNGDGTFTDIASTVPRLKSVVEGETVKMVEEGKGLVRGAQESSKGLGVLIVDFNKDNKPDIYVANDTVDNFLYINHSENGKIALQEVAVELGVARDNRGTPNGSMGLAVGDYDMRGDPALFVTNYEGEMHALYRNVRETKEEGKKDLFYFDFKSSAAGISTTSKDSTVGWGTGFIDLEHRGKLDLIYVTGHAVAKPEAMGSTRKQMPKILRHIGEGKYKNYSVRGGEYFKNPHLARGLALGDLDNDGKIDLVVCHTNDPVSILKNVTPTDNHWLGVSLERPRHRNSVGAKIIVEANGMTQYRFQTGGGSYESASDQRHVIGLGDATEIQKVTVVWPDGQKQEWSELAVDQYHKLIQQ